MVRRRAKRTSLASAMILELATLFGIVALAQPTWTRALVERIPEVGSEAQPADPQPVGRSSAVGPVNTSGVAEGGVIASGAKYAGRGQAAIVSPPAWQPEVNPAATAWGPPVNSVAGRSFYAADARWMVPVQPQPATVPNMVPIYPAAPGAYR